MATTYNHKAVEKKWRGNWEAHPINVILLPGYVPVSVRKRSSCRSLERLCNQ